MTLGHCYITFLEKKLFILTWKEPEVHLFKKLEVDFLNPNSQNHRVAA